MSPYLIGVTKLTFRVSTLTSGLVKPKFLQSLGFKPIYKPNIDFVSLQNIDCQTCAGITYKCDANLLTRSLPYW